jgi:hypothetical protein
MTPFVASMEVVRSDVDFEERNKAEKFMHLKGACSKKNISVEPEFLELL